jgi:uncharacterized repeat protein (TIGR03803 family)
MKVLAFNIALAVALCASQADSQTFTTLVNFTGTSGTATGQFPIGSLTLGGTTLYGMTQYGGKNGDGTAFSVGIDGTSFQNLVSFTGSGGTASGLNPWGNLTISGKTLYGMTQSGAANGIGNVFSVGADGTNYQNLLSFTGTGSAASGGLPYGSLALSGTTLYGMTSGLFSGVTYSGNVFSVGTGGTNYQNLVNFTGTSGSASGRWPYGSLTLSGTTLYGMTQSGGTPGVGNVFSVGADSTNYHNLLTFTGSGGAASGAQPRGSLTLSGTTLYGMTFGGGVHGDGNVFSVGIDGTNYHNLLSFTGSGGGAANGLQPNGSLTLSGTTLYGMTKSGGPNGLGNIFSVGIDGSGYDDLYNFVAPVFAPYGDLTLSGGTLFGMNSSGLGNVFALTLPTPAPEPATLALVGCGAVALVSYRWQKNRARRETRQ